MAKEAPPSIRREEDGVIDDQHAQWSRDLMNRADGSFLFPPTQVRQGRGLRGVLCCDRCEGSQLADFPIQTNTLRAQHNKHR